MSSLALMRWLESAPERYDAGMRLITLGRAPRIQEAVAEAAAPRPGAVVLEIGCGTGAVTRRLLDRGAHVTALDSNPAMLEQCRERVRGAPSGEFTILERAAAEIDGLPAAAFDAVVASFSLSEMGRAERAFVLREAARRLRPGAALVVADELRPTSGLARLVLGLLRGPQVAVAWLVAGSLSHPLPDLAAEIAETGLGVSSEQRWLWGSLGMLVARRAPAQR